MKKLNVEWTKNAKHILNTLFVGLFLYPYIYDTKLKIIGRLWIQ
jgi:hypothetical protein